MKLPAAKWGGPCKKCGVSIQIGETIEWDPTTKKIYHPSCAPEAVTSPPPVAAGTNQYAGICHTCGKSLAAGSGKLDNAGGKWIVLCAPSCNALPQITSSDLPALPLMAKAGLEEVLQASYDSALPAAGSPETALTAALSVLKPASVAQLIASGIKYVACGDGIVFLAEQKGEGATIGGMPILWVPLFLPAHPWAQVASPPLLAALPKVPVKAPVKVAKKPTKPESTGAGIPIAVIAAFEQLAKAVDQAPGLVAQPGAKTPLREGMRVRVTAKALGEYLGVLDPSDLVDGRVVSVSAVVEFGAGGIRAHVPALHLVAFEQTLKAVGTDDKEPF